jgi:hypothetical protein
MPKSLQTQCLLKPFPEELRNARFSDGPGVDILPRFHSALKGRCRNPHRHPFTRATLSCCTLVHIFTGDPLRSMFSGNGFTWDAVYDEQPLVLVNLGARKLDTSIDH